MPLFSRLVGMLVVLCAVFALSACSGLVSKTSPLRSVQPLKQDVLDRLKSIGSSPGAPMLIRIFKQSNEFEVWKGTSTGQFKLFKTYQICAWSGALGPKIVEGDRQAPEGFYNLTPGLLNPNSNYYLAFNTGFPNKFDKAWGRTGANLMIHGDCSSAGCFAMTDQSVAEIYALGRETFNGGNTIIQMQIFPFRMTAQNLAQVHDNPNMPFWMDIKEGYDRFELSKTPPTWDVCDKKYVFDLSGPDGAALDPQSACPARSSDALGSALASKEAADNAAYKVQVAALEDKAAKDAAAKQAQQDTVAAEKARGNAIGGFFSGIFGGGSAQGTPTTPPANTTVVAPTPFPAPTWG